MKETLHPAIVAVGYDRPDELRRLLQSVEQADYPAQDITLVVSLDRSGKTAELEQVARGVGWSHGKLVIRTFPERQGLKNHVLQCGDLALEYGAVIILEDDLVVSKCFYNYVVQALAFYGDAPEITGISLYSHVWNGYANFEFTAQKNEYDAYLGQFSISWGQCWTKEQWQRFRAWYAGKEKTGLTADLRLPQSIENWGEKSWGKYFVYYLVENDLYYVIPYTSLSTNCSAVGEHNSRVSTAHQVMLLAAENMAYRFPPVDKAIRYDLFFERIFDGAERIAGIPAADICIDLHGRHRDANGRPYLLTCQAQKDLRPVRTYGLQRRPVEENIISDVPGSAFYLYAVPASFCKTPETWSASAERLEYELYDHSWKRMLKTGVRGFADALRRKVLRSKK